MIGILLIVVVILLVAGAAPVWPHSKKWGPAPTLILTIVLIAVLWAVLTGRV